MLKMIYCEETKRFQSELKTVKENIKKLDDLINKVFEEKEEILKNKGFSSWSYRKSETIIPEYEEKKEELKKLSDLIENEKIKEKVILLATKFKISYISWNLCLDLVDVLNDLKLTDANLTEKRKEKIISELLKREVISNKNSICVGRNNYHYYLHVGSIGCCWNNGLEVNAWDYHFKKRDEHSKRRIESDDYYLELAKNYYNDYKQLQNKLESINKELEDSLISFNSKYEETNNRAYYKSLSVLEEL